MLVSYSALYTAEHRKPTAPTKSVAAPAPAFSLDTIHHIEEAHMIHLGRQVDASKQLFPNEDLNLHHVPSGGVAALTIPFLGQQVNRTLGLGMEGPVTDYDIRELEDLHRASNLPVSVLLCPYADPSALQMLAVRGYGVDSFLNIYARSLNDIPVNMDQEPEYTFGFDTRVSRAPATEAGMAAFIHNSVAGFMDGGRPVTFLRAVAEMAALRTDTVLYLAKIDGQIAGCGAMAFMETEYGRVAHIYIDSTTPAFRGRGVQRALIRARVLDAKRLGYNFVTVHANPGVGTGRNVEKEGFRLAFTKPIFTKRQN